MPEEVKRLQEDIEKKGIRPREEGRI